MAALQHRLTIKVMMEARTWKKNRCFGSKQPTNLPPLSDIRSNQKSILQHILLGNCHPKLIPLVVRNYKPLGEGRKQITEQKREKREEKYQRNTFFWEHSLALLVLSQKP